MRTFIISALFFNALHSWSQAPDWAWAREAQSANIDEVKDVAGDATGNVYVTGYFTGPVLTVGGSTLSNSSSGTMQYFVAKYDRTGTVLWAHAAGGSDDDTGTGIAVDGAGNVYVCGEYESTTITFGSSAHTNTSQAGQADIFVVKYSPSGTVLWSRSYGGGLQEEANDIAVDASGNIAFTGNYYSLSVLFGSYGVINSGASDAFVVKISSAGAPQWAKRIGGGMIDNGQAVGIDNSGNVYVAGDYNSNSVPSFTPALSNSGGFDVFVAKFSSTGSSLYASRFGGSGDEGATALFASSAGDFYAAGYFESGSIQIGSTSLSNSGTRSMFIAKYNTSGSAQWAQKTNASMNTAPSGIVAEGTSVYMTGSFDLSSLTFGSSTISNGGSLDGFVASYAAAGGSVQWARSTNSAGLDQSNAVAVSGGNVHIGGIFTATLVLRDNKLVATGQSDGFVVKMCFPPAAPSSATGATACAGAPMVLTGNVPAGTTPAWFSSATGGTPITTGNLSTTSPGTYYLAAKDTNAGCAMFSSTRIAVNAAHHPVVNATVSVSGHTLTSSGNGSVAAWFNCETTSTISGQSSNSYVLTASGHFAVIMVSPQGCRDTSACNHYSYTPGSDTTIVTVGIRESSEIMPKLSVYPNPSSGSFTVRSSQSLTCSLVNALGVTIERFVLDDRNNRSRNVGPLPHGVYFLVTDKRRAAARVVVSQ